MGSLTTGSLLNLKSHSTSLMNGAVQIDTSKMTKGKAIVMDLSDLTEGTGIEMNDNTKLTSGKLLDIRTTSSSAQNPVSISAPQISNGKVVDISSDGLTSGSAMVLSTNNGSSMINTLMGKQISEIKENGEIRATKDITEHYFIYDNVVIDNCEDSSNDGSYKIKSISSNIIAKYNCAIECYNSSASVPMISSMLDSNKTVNASNTSSPSSNTTSKIVSSYVCAVVNDCPASNRSIEYVKASACTSSNNTYCDNSVLYVFIRVMNKDGTDVSSFVARNSNNGKISCEISRMGGEILSIDGNNQRSGTLLDIKANKMQNGIGMHIHNMESDTLTSGSLLQVSTKTTSPENGIIRVNSKNVQSGKIVSIEADALTSGNAIEVSNKGNALTTGSLLNLESYASKSDNGIMRVNSKNVQSGKIVSIEADA